MFNLIKVLKTAKSSASKLKANDAKPRAKRSPTRKIGARHETKSEDFYSPVKNPKKNAKAKAQPKAKAKAKASGRKAAPKVSKRLKADAGIKAKAGKARSQKRGNGRAATAKALAKRKIVIASSVSEMESTLSESIASSAFWTISSNVFLATGYL